MYYTHLAVRGLNVDEGEVEVLITGRLQLGVHPQATIDAYHIAFLELGLDVSGVGISKTTDGMVVLLHSALPRRRGGVQ
jgi:hypothetical protein